ncbi:MAG: hypothetical protein A2086_04925 [Spirochaetes bacterium GWD1_27_9]|nr:MAG: hypothetical protein A2Z98_06940 [Spirochaetes bacterium GWB1_27_13]OHD21483.1 MAG: hypothetical protein A2Y34_01370 [Spirochaetes bacterium GWC1_27_15]OHD42451.1 MAG: hypothetical protein A2086_04925 [Spirochaetes bacterium GWD1_27_9]
MRLHYLQHCNFETPANILEWAAKKNMTVTSTMFFNDPKLPKMDDFDLLVVMGGPMNVYEEDKFPFLKEEKKFIEDAIEMNKKVVGICLGAQLISCVLGGKVTKNKFKEIGFFNVKKTNPKDNLKILELIPDEFLCFHWHGDTFEIPKQATSIFKSEGCDNQGFIYKNNVLALQFHLELNKNGLYSLIDNCKNELTKALYIQDETKIIANIKHLQQMEGLMNKILDNFLEE